MEAGRELDALVAEKVMGWKRVTMMGITTRWITPKNIESWSIPYYSTDVSAAWKIWNKMKDGEHWQKFARYIMQYDSHRTTEIALFEISPLTICLAALKAVGAVQEQL